MNPSKMHSKHKLLPICAVLNSRSCDRLVLMGVIWILVAVTGILNITGLASEFATLTVSGIAGIAASLALQSTLSNIISGILLFKDKAIRLDDEIQIGGIRGKIVHIGLRNSWIGTNDGNLVFMSNSNLSAGPLINFTASNRLAHLED